MSHTITLTETGHQFSAEDGEAILDAALRQQINLVYGCRNGNCGSCAARVLTGEIDYPEGQPSGLKEFDTPAIRALLCQAVALSDLEIAAEEIGSGSDIKVKMLPMKVQSLNKLADDVILLKLKLPPTERMQFLAGQYIEFVLPDGRRRAFSIANAPHDDAFLELHVRDVPGGYFTDLVFQEMKPKAIVRVEGPYGCFYLREDSIAPVILMAGGTGLAPVKGMVEHMLATGNEREMHIFWGMRAKADLYLHDQLLEWAQTHKHIHYTPVLSEPAAGDEWQGKTGFVHEAVAEAFPDLSGHQVYMSGPPPMIEAAKALFTESCQLNADNLFFDSFDFSRDTQNAIAAE